MAVLLTEQQFSPAAALLLAAADPHASPAAVYTKKPHVVLLQGSKGLVSQLSELRLNGWRQIG